MENETCNGNKDNNIPRAELAAIAVTVEPVVVAAAAFAEQLAVVSDYRSHLRLAGMQTAAVPELLRAAVQGSHFASQ